ncbi:WD40/YVTN/BNR-like repeat-containing protein [Streptomyces sp. NPDC056190]|uniref:WD40/YVTN/BNR-like repeat-containing protein n=1 Tax=Streptomyces sp. NPDC056190 TaxID=3345741 RepID=UPI0035DDD30C
MQMSPKLWRLSIFIVAAGTVAGVTPMVISSYGADHDRTAVQDRDKAAGESEGEEEEEEAPVDYLAVKHNSGHPVSAGQVTLARRQAARIPTGDASRPWQTVGPTNVGGRVIDLAIDPTTSPSTVYAGVSSGGIMKSTDGGVNWKAAWPSDTQQAMGALARGSDGTLWAGTGEANPSGGGTTFFGDGLYKSTDGGDSWDKWGLPDSGAFGRIAVDPKDPSQVWAAATGSLSWKSAQRGLYHLNNGGKDWKQALAPTNDHTGAIDVAIDPDNPKIILASLWDRSRNNGAFQYGGTGSGLYRSTDGGATWTRQDNSNINGSVCSWDQTKSGLNKDADLGRIGIAFATSGPKRAYIQFAGANGPDKGFYVSNDAGKTWTCGGGEPGSVTGGYEWVFGRLWVDPVDENHVFAADVSLRESTDGGNTWSNSSGPHADHHAMVWDPKEPGRVYNGDDGGVYHSTQNGATRTWTHSKVEPWNQSYHLSVSQQDPRRMVTGLQDQGSIRTWTPGTDPTDLTQWNSYGGGDGHWVQIDPDNQLRYYQCLQPSPPKISCGRRVDDAASGSTGSTNTSFSSPPWPSDTRITTDMPIVPDPADPDYVYVAGTSIARSGKGVVSGSNAWKLISPATPDSPESLPGKVPEDEINPDLYYANEYGAVTQIAPAKTTGTSTSPSSTIYAGTDTGKLWKTTDANADNPTWTQLGKGVLPERWVTAIGADPTDADHVYASFSNYREGDLAANVWESTDGGSTWTNISGNLPNAPVWMVTFDQAHNQLYAATDYGVFNLKNGKKNWARLGSELPNCPVLDVKLSADGGTVYAATFGRGIYQLPVKK